MKATITISDVPTVDGAAIDVRIDFDPSLDALDDASKSTPAQQLAAEFFSFLHAQQLAAARRLS